VKYHAELIGKFFVDSKNEYASLKYISPEDDSPEVVFFKYYILGMGKALFLMQFT
jgi:hypothetical protein